ncbi:interferon gamma receptor 1-like isoform X2 [Xyrauchen texanus]|uniref:interferon gamma receptor 1-like isoform X2 n=1 Tax=Xyrauchen texanus TaxID=154827 RepID=UPI002242BAF3|nr:interferon gamma receptor 1-like isoform X2 [Xyrauchen texanus]
MFKDPVFTMLLFFAFLCASVCGFVHPPTNISVDCHNFVNMLYWNYSKPAETLKFIIMIKSYERDSQTVETSQTRLNISEYTSDATDNYVATVMAHDGQEKSGNVSTEFTYSLDYSNYNTHKCSVDFPDVNMSVRKDVIEVSFLHPYYFYKQDFLKEDFEFKVTHDRQESIYECFDDDDELCAADIHLNQSFVGQCIELHFEGKIAGIPTNAYRNVCVPHLPVETDKSYITAVVGVVVVLLFIAGGFVWILCKKWSRIPQIPKNLRSFVTSPRLATTDNQPDQPILSAVMAEGHTPLLEPSETPTISPVEKDSSTVIIPTDTQVEVDHDTSGISFVESEDYGKSSDYDSPKFLLEMSPGELTHGYGPRPPVL